MIVQFRSILVLFVLSVLVAGCGDPVQSSPPTYAPTGYWWYRQTDSATGHTLRSRLLLESSKGTGTLIDTVSYPAAGGGMVDSIIRRRLEFTPVGDGYQRMLTITEQTGSAADTTLDYWYFFRRGDTLLYFSGMRF